MNLLALVTDEITEILIKIMQFTQRRQKVLTRNIREMGKPGFQPRDLAVEEFSESLNTAIEEYARNRRLVLCDTATIRFGLDGKVEARPVRDEPGKELLDRDRDEYLEFQLDKLLENSLNQRVAAELIRQRENQSSPF